LLIGAAVVSLNSTTSVSLAEEPLLRAPENLFAYFDTLPSISAKAYGVFDIETGAVIFAFNEEAELPIASVTKLFTAAAVLKSSVVDEEIVISPSAVAAEGRAGKLSVGEVYTPRELLFPLLLESSNDAAVAIEQVVEMIPLSKRLLADGSGLSDKNISTVGELMPEVRNLYLSEPYIFDITSLKQYIGESEGWINNSPVISLDGYRGGKHGYTTAAKRTLVAVFSEPKLAGREIGYVILGSEDLLTDIKELRSTVSDSAWVQ